MMQKIWNDLVQLWLEYWGRRRSPLLFSFPDNEVMTPESSFRVPFWARAIYLNLHPTLYAVAISPDGIPQRLKGGYNFPLSSGLYIIHFIDKRDRKGFIPKTSETTQDGVIVSLELIITYRVSDPIKLLEIQQPVATIFSFMQSDLKEYIRSQHYDEIFGSGDGQSIDSARLVQYIKQRHIDRHQVARVFAITNVAVNGWEGDPKLTEIRKNFQVQQKQNIASTEILKQNQELDRKVAAQDAEIKRINAQAEVAQQEILQEMKLQQVQLDNARRALSLQQEKWSRAMDALSQTLSTPNFQRDPREIEVIGQIVNQLKELTSKGTDPGDQVQKVNSREAVDKKDAENIDSLTDRLLSMLNRK
jgi:hypothetical protein